MSQSSTPDYHPTGYKRHLRSVVLLLLGGFALIYPFVVKPPPKAPEDDAIRLQPGIPDFGVFTNVVDKKQAFFAYLLPEIQRQNTIIMEERHFILSIAQKLSDGEALNARHTERLNKLAAKYQLKNPQYNLTLVNTLLNRADIIPEELVLVQAANESAWGTSRFARQGYNFFGLWCFKKGCGFVPSRRNDGAEHEVARFSNLSHAVMTYMRNLNRHSAYSEMRNIRQALRENHQPVSAEAMVQGLMNYSERGQDYIDELLNMIRYNRKYMQI